MSRMSRPWISQWEHRQRNPPARRGQRGDESHEHRIEVRLPEADPRQDHPRRWSECGKQVERKDRAEKDGQCHDDLSVCTHTSPGKQRGHGEEPGEHGHSHQ